MEPNNLEGRSRGSSFRRRALTLVGVSALTLSGVGAAVFGASQAFASSTPVPVASFNIGTGVSNVTLATSDSTEAAKGVLYTVGFTATSALPKGDTVTLTASGGTLNTTGTIADTTESLGAQPVTLSSGAFTTPFAISAGDTVSIQALNATNLSTGSLQVSVATTTDGVATNSNKVALVPAATLNASLSPQTPQTSAAILTIANATTPTAAVSADANYLLVSDSGPYNTSGTETSVFPSSNSDYTVTDTTSGASQTVSGTVTVGQSLGSSSTSLDSYAYFLSPITIGTSDKFTVTINNFTNDAASQQQTLEVVPLGTGVITTPTSAAAIGTLTPSTTAPVYIQATGSAVAYWATAPAQTTGANVYAGSSTLTGTSVTGVSAALTSSQVSAPNVTYSVSFTATHAATTLTVVGKDSAGNTTFDPHSGTSILTDNSSSTTSTQSVTFAAGGVASSLTTPLVAGHNYTLTVYGITNYTTAEAATISVSTGGDIVPADVTYTLASAQEATISISPATPGTSSVWTVSGFKTLDNLAGGSGTLTIASAGSNLFPSIASDYVLTDSTTPAGSGTASAVSASAGTVTVTVPNNVVANDVLQLVISGVVNSSTADAQSGVTITSNGTKGLIGVAVSAPAPAPAAAPSAATTGSNGALVNVNGTIYVYAGGVAFGIPTPADFNAISASVGNPTVVTASSVTTSGTVRNGTLLQVVGSPEIGVVSSGTYTGFSTASQFLSDGYSFANVIQVPNLGSLATGTGTPANAAATAADGALVNVSGTIYVYAGGVAMGIPTPAVFSTISAAEGNPTVVTATSVTTTGTMATGTLVQVAGSPQINVETSTGTQVGFATASGFTSGGYSWGKVIMIP